MLLLDSGDTIEGAPVEAMVSQGAFGDRGDPIIRAMNAVVYDAMAVGNHEFNFGLERLERSRRRGGIPLALGEHRPGGREPGVQAVHRA